MRPGFGKLGTAKYSEIPASGPYQSPRFVGGFVHSGVFQLLSLNTRAAHESLVRRVDGDPKCGVFSSITPQYLGRAASYEAGTTQSARSNPCSDSITTSRCRAAGEWRAARGRAN